MEGRVNPTFFGEGYQSLLKTLSFIPHIRKLGELISEGAFGVLPPGNSYVKEGGIRFLRATELQNDNQIDWSACLRAPIEFARHERAQLKIGDILIAVKGATIASEKSICTVASLDEQTIINGSIFRFQPTAETTSAFLREVLSSNFIKQQMKASLILNNAVDYLSRTSLDSLALPLPAIQAQRLLVEEMEAARATRKQKLTEADALLAGVDDFVLRQLGLTVPQEEKRLSFAVRRSNIETLACSPFTLTFLRLLQSWKSCQWYQGTLETWVNVNPATDVLALEADSVVSFLPMEAVGERNGEIQLQEAKYQEVKQGYTCFSEGDLLFAKITPCMQNGKVAVARGLRSGIGFGSTEFHVLRVKSSAMILPEYLEAMLSLKHFLSAAQASFTGSAGHQRVPENILRSLPLPLPPLSIQQTIAAEITRRRGQARRLRDEANTGWQAAKIRFEAQLLGDY